MPSKKKVKAPRKTPGPTSKITLPLELEDPAFLKKINTQLRNSSVKRNRKFPGSNAKKLFDDHSSTSVALNLAFITLMRHLG